MKLKQLLLMAALVMPFSVGAATLSLSGTTVTGINNLEIDGQFYDGVFSTGAWNSNSFGFTSEQFALDASNALAGYLNSGDSDATNWLNDVYSTQQCTGTFCYLITAFNSSVDAYLARILGGATWVGGITVDADHNSRAYTFVDWSAASVSTVPLPAAVWLFGPALLGFMGFRRKAVDTAAA